MSFFNTDIYSKIFISHVISNKEICISEKKNILFWNYLKEFKSDAKNLIKGTLVLLFKQT